jgi:hypothetical protein
MAISTQPELITAIQNYMMDRTDLATPAPEFITLGEAIIAYGFDSPTLKIHPLRCRDMEDIETITLTTGVGPLPADYLQYRRVVQTTAPRRDLEYITPTGADQQYPSRSSGSGHHFTIIGANLYTFPLVATSCELTYYAKVPALTSLATTNWLLTKNPGIYLRASLFIAAEYIKDDAEMTKHAGFLKALIGAMNGSDQMANQAKAGVTFRTRVR